MDLERFKSYRRSVTVNAFGFNDIEIRSISVADSLYIADAVRATEDKSIAQYLYLERCVYQDGERVFADGEWQVIMTLDHAEVKTLLEAAIRVNRLNVIIEDDTKN